MRCDRIKNTHIQQGQFWIQIKVNRKWKSELSSASSILSCISFFLCMFFCTFLSFAHPERSQAIGSLFWMIQREQIAIASTKLFRVLRLKLAIEFLVLSFCLLDFREFCLRQIPKIFRKIEPRWFDHDRRSLAWLSHHLQPHRSRAHCESTSHGVGCLLLGYW